MCGLSILNMEIVQKFILPTFNFCLEVGKCFGVKFKYVVLLFKNSKVKNLFIHHNNITMLVDVVSHVET